MNAARLPRRPTDGLTPAQRRSAVGAIFALHAAAAWGLMQVESVSQAVVDSTPIFVSMVQPAAEPAPPRPPEVTPAPRTAPTPARRIVSAPATTEPSAQTAPDLAPPTLAAEAPPQPAAFEPPAPAPSPLPSPSEPRQIPPSAVQYLDAPVLEVPPASARAGESGRSVVRVLIDERGLPRTVQIAQSSGFKRLDEAALAAVRRARFRPYTENGQPRPGWAHIPLVFELEQ